MEVGLAREGAHGHVGVVVLAEPLGDEAHQVVREVGAYELAPQLEDGVHRLNVPGVVRRVALGELRDLLDESRAELEVGGVAQVRDELLDYEDHVRGVRHPEEELERLALERLVRIVHALDDEQLVLERVLLVHLHDGCERLDPQVLEVVVVRRDKAPDVARRRLEQVHIRVDRRHRAHALVDDRVPYVDAGICAAEDVEEGLVHGAARRLVRRPQSRQQLQQLDLDPRRWHPVVVERRRQPMLCHLFEDGDERRHEILLRLWVGLRCLVEDVERRAHHGRVLGGGRGGGGGGGGGVKSRREGAGEISGGFGPNALRHVWALCHECGQAG